MVLQGNSIFNPKMLPTNFLFKKKRRGEIASSDQARRGILYSKAKRAREWDDHRNLFKLVFPLLSKTIITTIQIPKKTTSQIQATRCK